MDVSSHNLIANAIEIWMKPLSTIEGGFISDGLSQVSCFHELTISWDDVEEGENEPNKIFFCDSEIIAKKVFVWTTADSNIFELRIGYLKQEIHEQTDPCSSNPCGNNGRCSEIDGSCTCN